jgi:hypothetical protein
MGKHKARDRRRKIEGVALVAVGAVLMVLPGPGIPIVAAGVARLRPRRQRTRPHGHRR